MSLTFKTTNSEVNQNVRLLVDDFRQDPSICLHFAHYAIQRLQGRSPHQLGYECIEWRG
jgi:hypothetical protein